MMDRNVLLTSVGFFFVFFGFGAAQQYLVPLLSLQGKENLALTSLLILYFSFLVAGISAPKIISKLGLKKSIVLGSSTYWIFTLSVTTGNPLVLMSASALIGIGAALMWISSGKIISDSSTKANIGRNLGFQFALFLIGNLFGIAFGGFLITSVAPDTLYLCLTFSIMLSLPFFLGLSTKTGAHKPEKFNPYFMFDRRVVLLFPLVFSTYFIYSQTFASMSLIILALFGIGFVGVLATVVRIVSMISGLSVGRIADKFRKDRLIYILSLVGFAGTAVFLLTNEMIFIVLGSVLIGVFISAAYPVCLAMLKESVKEKEYVYAVGSFHVYTTIATISAVFFTMITDPRLSFIPGLILLAVAPLAIFVLNKEKSQR
jgi:MFS family permease